MYLGGAHVCFRSGSTAVLVLVRLITESPASMCGADMALPHDPRANRVRQACVALIWPCLMIHGLIESGKHVWRCERYGREIALLHDPREPNSGGPTLLICR
jgi:hypothetical protein